MRVLKLYCISLRMEETAYQHVKLLQSQEGLYEAVQAEADEISAVSSLMSSNQQNMK